MFFPAQKKHIFSVVMLIFLLGIPFCLTGKELFCRICRGQITGRYFLVNKSPCCSRECANELQRRLLPECELCRRSMTRFVRITSHNGERSYCPACNARPKCFHCKFPARSLQRLSDGRRLCRDCSHFPITDNHSAAELFEKTREMLGRRLGIRTGHKITFFLTDTRKMTSLHRGGSPEKEWGLFICRKQTQTRVIRSSRTGRIIRKVQLPVEKKYSICILSHLSNGSFTQTAAHELTHDFMEEYYPHIKDPLWCEGAAEYVASLYNIISKNSGRNSAMEKNQDPVYGKGFRMIKSMIPSHLSPREKADHLKKILARKNREEMR